MQIHSRHVVATYTIMLARDLMKYLPKSPLHESFEWMNTKRTCICIYLCILDDWSSGTQRM